MPGRTCSYLMPSGRPCRATPLRNELFCSWHSPETAEEAARRVESADCTGARRRRSAPSTAFTGCDRSRTTKHLLETAAIETLALENSIARNRALAGFAAVGAKSIEIGDLEERLRALEAAKVQRADEEADPFPDVEP